MNHKPAYALTLALALSSAFSVNAQVQPTRQGMQFSGSFAQPDGPVDLRFRLFPTATQGTFCFEGTQTVQVSAGSFFAFIGDGTVGGIPSSPCFQQPSLWIAFALNAAPDTEIGDRTPISSAGYAHTFNPGASVSGSNSNQILSVAQNSGADSAAGLRAEATGASGATIGVQGTSSSVAGTGVVGLASSNATIGDTRPIGVRGTASGILGFGGVGEAPRLGVRGVANHPNFGSAGVAGLASGERGIGVIGEATFAGSVNTQPIGVKGTATSPQGIGVLGHNLFGGTGLVTKGVVGWASSTAGIGVEGEAYGIGVHGISTTGIGVSGQTSVPTLPAVLARSAGDSPLNLGLRVLGRFEATGAKNSIVPLQDGQYVALYAKESTEVWFSDYGSVELAQGRALVQLDSEFLQTVDTQKDYHVFLTARGNPTGALYIDRQTPMSFEIRESTGTANVKVSYRIVAKRKDLTEARLEKRALPAGEPASDR